MTHHDPLVVLFQLFGMECRKPFFDKVNFSAPMVPFHVTISCWNVKNFLVPYFVTYPSYGIANVQFFHSTHTSVPLYISTRKMSRDFPGFFMRFPGFPMLSRDFYSFPAGFEFFWRRNVPPPHTQNVEVLVIFVYTAYGPIHQICLSVWDNHYLNSRWL